MAGLAPHFSNGSHLRSSVPHQKSLTLTPKSKPNPIKNAPWHTYICMNQQSRQNRKWGSSAIGKFLSLLFLFSHKGYTCRSMPPHIVSYYTMPCHTIPYHTTPYQTIPYHTTPHHTKPYHTIPHHTIPYHTIPYHTIPYHTTPYYKVPLRDAGNMKSRGRRKAKRETLVTHV